MKILSHSTSCLGTAIFTLQFNGMRKPEEFIVYPIKDKTDNIQFQSSTRWAELNTNTKTFEISARRQQYANYVWFQVCKYNGTTKTEEITEEDYNTIIKKIASTVGSLVGNNFLNIKCDNSAADKL
jgi:hypothetical protein